MIHALPMPSIDDVKLPLADGGFVQIKMLRLDTVDPTMSGNKAYKLLPNIEYAMTHECDTLLSFGGAFSNHLFALAMAGQKYGLKTVAVVRGEIDAAKNSTLSKAIKSGMKCHFVDRQVYRRRFDRDYLAFWQDKYPNAHIIPEGGSNELARQGCQRLGEQLRDILSLDATLLVSVGTGTTLQGLQAGLKGHAKVLGVAAIKGMQPMADVDLLDSYHFGGYGKMTADLVMLMHRFEELNQIEIDPVYTAKMVAAASDMVSTGKLNPSNLIIVHTGGVQGKQGMLERLISLGYRVSA
jgi:1-aminocyclopropane-1-carboxylate deaminase